ncbi:MAG TPA: hypothetical protein VFG00_00480, partial [Acidothermaceae bacterium]|nr:hypothetical protein [Acidothermaceae bacterium]
MPNTLYVISTRAAKNWWRDFYPEEAAADRAGEAQIWDDERAAAIIWEIATKNPAALRPWRAIAKAERRQRVNTSVRPHDKRKYTGAAVERYMNSLPSYSMLPQELKDVFCHQRETGFGWDDNNMRDYKLSLMLPFAMALADEDITSRAKWEWVLGLYAHGYPSFYRRQAVAELTERIAKQQTGKARKKDVSRDERKAAMKHGRWCLRQLYYLS